MQAAVVLRAPDTAVSGSASKPLAEGGALAGADIGLVAIVQVHFACVTWTAPSFFQAALMHHWVQISSTCCHANCVYAFLMLQTCPHDCTPLHACLAV